MDLGALMSLWALDRELFRAIHVGLRREFLDPIFLLITYTGDGFIQIPTILFLALNKKTRALGLAVVAAFACSGLIRLLIKDLVDRPRPSNFEWADPVRFPVPLDGFLKHLLDTVPYGNSSFPSGHATTSFAIAFMVAWWVRGSDWAWFGWAAVLWATLVGFSRVYVGVHYPFDIVGAAGLAAMVSTGLFLWWDKKGWAPRGLEPSFPSMRGSGHTE